MVKGERYLIGKRQDIIVVIEELGGPCKVLDEGVIEEVSTRSRIPIPWLPSCEMWWLSLGRIRADETYPSFPIEIRASIETEDIAEGWGKRGPQRTRTLMYLRAFTTRNEPSEVLTL